MSFYPLFCFTSSFTLSSLSSTLSSVLYFSSFCYTSLVQMASFVCRWVFFSSSLTLDSLSLPSFMHHSPFSIFKYHLLPITIFFSSTTLFLLFPLQLTFLFSSPPLTPTLSTLPLKFLLLVCYCP